MTTTSVAKKVEVSKGVFLLSKQTTSYEAPACDFLKAFTHSVTHNSMKLGVASIKSNMTCRPRRAGQLGVINGKGMRAISRGIYRAPVRTLLPPV